MANFQAIISLIDLQKSSEISESGEDIRFVEENVRAMAIAYRLAYAGSTMNEVACGEFVCEVISDLRLIAGVSNDQVSIDQSPGLGTMGLDLAITFGLYLASVVPAYLNVAKQTGGSVRIFAAGDVDIMSFSIAGDRPGPADRAALCNRLGRAYLVQLRAEALSTPESPELHIRFELDRPRPLISLP
jgi:hypothetical protein